MSQQIGAPPKNPECWCIRFAPINQRALTHPDSVWTISGISGNWDAVQSTIVGMGGTAVDLPIYNDQGFEIGDLRAVEICLPREYPGVRTSVFTYTSPFGDGEVRGTWQASVCAEVEHEKQCWKQRFFECGVDNTYTSFRDTGATLTFKFVDCPDSVQPIPDGTGGWSQQIAQFSAAVSAAMPDSFEHGVYCTNGCGGLPQPTVELPDMKWRYAGWRVCPGDKLPIEVEYNSDQRQGVILDLNVIESPTRHFDRCTNCDDDADVWIDCATGAVLSDEELAGGKPICTIPCADTFPDLPDLALCGRTVTPGCFFDADGGLIQAGVTQLAKLCDDILQVQYLVQVGETGQEEVVIPLDGYFGDCATGEPIGGPEPDPELGENCEVPVYTRECPPMPCPPPSIEVYCDTDETKYVVVGHATDECGVSGTFLAEPYFSDPQALTVYAPAGTPQICPDATVKDQKCLIDECGDRWTCVDVVTPVNGVPVESQTCVPYIAPVCEDDGETEGEGRVAREVKRKAVKALAAVKSIKVSVAEVNTQITETVVDGEMPTPVGETCPCPCPDIDGCLPAEGQCWYVEKSAAIRPYGDGNLLGTGPANSFAGATLDGHVCGIWETTAATYGSGPLNYGTTPPIGTTNFFVSTYNSASGIYTNTVRVNTWSKDGACAVKSRLRFTDVDTPFGTNAGEKYNVSGLSGYSSIDYYAGPPSGTPQPYYPFWEQTIAGQAYDDTLATIAADGSVCPAAPQAGSGVQIQACYNGDIRNQTFTGSTDQGGQSVSWIYVTYLAPLRAECVNGELQLWDDRSFDEQDPYNEDGTPKLSSVQVELDEAQLRSCCESSAYEPGSCGCSFDPFADCDTESELVIRCSDGEQSVDGLDAEGNAVTVVFADGDEIGYAVNTCDGVVVGFTVVSINDATVQILLPAPGDPTDPDPAPFLTAACDPEPQIGDAYCVQDEKGVRWNCYDIVSVVSGITTVCFTADGNKPGTPNGETIPCPTDDPLLACFERIKLLLECCPKLDAGDAEHTTTSSNGDPGSLVLFPVTTLPNETSDFAVPISLGEYDCLSDPEMPIVVRWCFDHGIDPSTSHSGFNVSASDGTNTIGTVLQSSNGLAPTGVHIGPPTPHNGPRTKQWVDMQFTVAELQAGLSLQTSAFGTISDETETVYSQSVEIVTDMSELGCCAR